MSHCKIYIPWLLFATMINACEHSNEEEDFSGIYCLNIQNMEMTIVQSGNEVTFTLQADLLTNGTGTINADTLNLTATANGNETFTGHLVFSKDRKSFTGPFRITDANDLVTMDGILQGTKGGCLKYDIEARGVPKFISHDFTQLFKIEMISKFRSGFGHSFTDGNESCRSMKHYYNPYPAYRENNNVEVYSPVKGTIISVLTEGPGSSSGLTNKEIQIKPDDQPAFIIVIFHCDLASSAIQTGKRVTSGELIGYARMYYEEEGHYVTSFDIALYVNTPSGMRLVPYFSALTDGIFNSYVARGAQSRQDFIITKEERDADPLQCDGETFLTNGNLENWVILK
ncbi:MAG: hypothetical protein JXB19_01020 [Bacteroidales bacterium]|nr:hypothetical protein [Bacteroidales bacterium]